MLLSEREQQHCVELRDVAVLVVVAERCGTHCISKQRNALSHQDSCQCSDFPMRGYCGQPISLYFCHCFDLDQYVLPKQPANLDGGAHRGVILVEILVPDGPNFR